MKFYVITDTHYMSKKCWDEDPFSTPKHSNQLAIRESEEILSAMTDMICADNYCDFVFLTGDLTNCGDIESHDEIYKLLEKIEDSGKKVIAFPAGHDCYDFGVQYGYRIDKNGKKYKVARCRSNDIWAKYDRFLDFNTLEYHDNSRSRLLKLSDKTLALIIGKKQSDNEEPIENYYLELDWCEDIIKKYTSEGYTILGFWHYPVITSKIYNLFGGNNFVKDHMTVAKRFSKAGLNIIFTGHSHIHDIEFVENDGIPFYDISTSSPISYPAVIRKVDYNETDKIVDIKTIELPLPSIITEAKDLNEFTKNGFIGLVEELLLTMGTDTNRFFGACASLGVNVKSLEKYNFFIKIIGKYLSNLTFGKVGRWTRKETKLRKKDYADIKKEKILPFVISCIDRIFAGDASVSPDSNEFKISMAFVAILDSLVKCLPINIYKKLEIDNLADIVEPIIFNAGICDSDAVINLCEPAPVIKSFPRYKSHKGWKIIAVAVIAIIILLPLLIPTALIAGLFVGIKKLFSHKEKQRKND